MSSVSRSRSIFNKALENVEGGKENLTEASGSDIPEIMNGLVPLKYCLGICFSNP